VTRSKIRSPDSGSPSPEQPRAQRASFTSTQTAKERPPKEDRVYYGDEAEIADSWFVKGLVNICGLDVLIQ
jgi:hypothetical protein